MLEIIIYHSLVSILSNLHLIIKIFLIIYLQNFCENNSKKCYKKTSSNIRLHKILLQYSQIHFSLLFCRCGGGGIKFGVMAHTTVGSVRMIGQKEANATVGTVFSLNSDRAILFKLQKTQYVKFLVFANRFNVFWGVPCTSLLLFLLSTIKGGTSLLFEKMI